MKEEMKDINALTPRDAAVAELLLALAARCEAAESSADLCVEIARAVGKGMGRLFTDSIDDAVMLIPEGASWALEALCLEINNVGATIYPDYGEDPYEKHSAFAPTPALALCAAALRARAAIAEQSREPMQSGEANPPPQGSAP